MDSLHLFGIATDDGVIMGTYIHQVFEEKKPNTIPEVREAVLEAGKKSVRPAMMTAAVAIIALLPVLTSTGKGADIMIPMAIPTFGGMSITNHDHVRGTCFTSLLERNRN